MRTILSIVLVFLLAGCKRADLGQNASPSVQPLPGVGLYGQADPLAQALAAEQWAAQLSDLDPQIRQQASQALGTLGPEGARYLIQGMRSSSPEMQLNSLQGFYKPELVNHANETMPIVMGMLEHRDPTIRLNAVARMPWFEASASKAMPLLQYMAANDPSPEVRAAAKESMVFINYFATGVKPKHGH